MKHAFLAAVLIGVLGWEGCTVPAWVNTVEADAKVAEPIAASLIDVIDPALAPLVTVISSGFAALANTLDTYKSSPTASNLQAVEAAFQAVDANVAQLESAAQIKNAATASTVTEVVALLSQAVAEITATIPAPASASANLKVAVRATPKHWTANDLKKQYNAIAKRDARLRKL